MKKILLLSVLFICLVLGGMDMILPYAYFINVEMEQATRYCCAWGLFTLAVLVICLLCLYIKKYVHKTEPQLSYGTPIAKILWLYLILAISVLIVNNFYNASRSIFPFYTACYVVIFIYYLCVIVRVREFGIKQILFNEILQRGQFIKEEWKESKKRTAIIYLGLSMFSLFYIVPYVLSNLLININHSLQIYKRNCYSFNRIERIVHEGDYKWQSNMYKHFSDKYDLYNGISISILIVCISLIVILISRIWIYPSHKNNTQYEK